MRILVTGHEGCVGSHLVKYLAQKSTVVCFEGDITNKDDWDKYYGNQKFNALIHLAAIAGVRRSFNEPEFYYHNNVVGTTNALKFAEDAMIDKVLYASSSNAYEWWGNPYAATKKMCEILAEPHNNAKGMRFHTVWPGRPDMLYQNLVKGNVSYINANHYRDWIHVEDLCEAMWTILLNWSMIDEKVLDIGTGKSFNEAGQLASRMDSSSASLGLFVQRPHVTMAHFSQLSQQNILKEYTYADGKSVTLTITGILIGETIAAFSIRLPDYLNGTEPLAAPPCQNSFPHITVWVGNDESAAKSNDLPAMVERNEAIKVELAQCIDASGTLCFWYI